MQNKIIIMVGVNDKRGSTNIPMCKSLMKLGFHVIPINYRTIIQSHGMQFFANLLLSVITNTKPYLTIFSKCNGVPTEVVKECSKYSTTWLYNMDARPTIEKCTDVVQHAINCHFSSCTAYEMVDWFNEQGANCHYIVQGVDPEVFKPVSINEKYRSNMSGPVISMIGARTIERDEYFKALTDDGFFPTFYGPGYNKEIIDKDFVEVCCSSDFMLSLNTHNGIHKGYFSNRLVRYLACGTCTFHLDPFGDLEKYFEDGKEIVFFKDKNDLVNKLHSIDDDTRIKIGINGRERILREYTWDHKISNLLGIVKKDK